MKARRPARAATIVLMCGVTAVLTGCGTGSSQPRLSPARYRAKLHSVDKPVTTALARIHKAHGYKSLDHRLKHATHEAKKAANVLGKALPPKKVTKQAVTFDEALNHLVVDLHDLRDQLSDGELCAASSVLGTLRTMKSAKSVPRAASALNDNGYPTALKLPHLPKLRNRRPSNGHVVEERDRTGRGILKVKASGLSDVVLTLARHKHAAYSLYVRKNDKATLHGVVDGRYTIYFMSGKDWDPHSDSFTRNCHYQRYIKTIKYIEPSRGEWDVNLHRHRGGKQTTNNVDPKKFPTK